MQIADLGRSLIGDWQEGNPHAHELCYVTTGTIGALQNGEEEMATGL
jgi:hypothetical protein